MKRWAKILLVAAVVVVVAIASIPLFINANTFRPTVEKQLANALGRSVKVGDLRLSIFSGRMLSENLSVADDPNFGTEPFLTAKTLRLAVSLRALIFSHELELRGLEIDSPQINLIRTPNGVWNFSSIGRASASGPPNSSPSPSAASTASHGAAPPLAQLSVALIEVEDGRVSVAELPAQGAPRVYEHVNVTVRDFTFASQFPFELSANLPADGKISAKGQLGPINRDDAAVTPAQAQILLRHFDPVAAGFLNPEAGLSLIADIDTHVVSDGKTATGNGAAQLQNLKLRKGGKAAPQPVALTYSATHQLKENSGQIEDASITVGDSVIHASGTYQPAAKAAEGPELNFKFAGENLPINDLQPLMTAAAVRMPNGSVLKGGTVSLNLAVHGQVKALAIFGPIAFANTRLVGFDIGSKIHGIAALSGIKTGDTTEFERLRLNMRMTNAGVVADKINAVIAGMGELTGSGTVSPADEMDFNLILQGANAKGIGKLGVGLLSTLSGSTGGKSGVPIHVAGTADEPYITADVGGIFGRKKK